ncbi:adenosylcobalamin-dependent ribonucleoside-diphosphate reductase [Ilyobacter polytropus]|uniref:Vitamin B12-dependent ribonucleotide reductase n=1 Tax=Ilyobacter polytropus (strain ATCC 51220 / DSM 2926 / LMG 16218 / CuHBu1) TaxID=572544 RepID=E3H7W5_ILYPC|nr:adenosylcobalamin-dependent ribonucleoside-diphosphate reductase [Ilyobacter polytropus]ADO82917.1 ribonucleoside-diphosphate reductase, adenosylcobalamin-dependent [Ilyobacter polytropus DSM 2926]
MDVLNIKEWLGEDNTLGIDIWEKKYKFDGETFVQWLDRVAGGDPKVKEMIWKKEFIFAGRILSNRGLHKVGKKITYSNCYVITPPDDNIESIFETAKKLARTFSYGGGCGVDISNLRPKGSEVNNSAKHTTGAVSFMDLYNLTTDIIGQKGRRGALMLSIDVNHPDVEDFIKVKSDLNKIQKANISVRINDEFMKAVEKGDMFKTEFIVGDTGETITKKVNARLLFKELARQNWNFAEPGVLFWDTISNWNLLSEDEEFEYAGTNPCAEEPLPPGGSCLLGSIVLPSFIEGEVFNFERLAERVRDGVKALNDVLDEGLPLHPLEEQRDSVRDWRQIGLGILGLGDLLINMKLKYGSPESLEFCDKVSKTIVDNALRASALLAKEQGSFPKYKKDKVLASPFLKDNASDETIELIEKYGLRNSQLLTIAPTGSIGTMLRTSTGIEPNFAFFYTRKTESLHGEDVFYKVFTPIAKDYMDENGIEDENDLPDYFVTAQNLNPFDRIKMQGIWQRRIDASISSTINLVHKTSIEEVEDLYIEAWKQGLKGMTIYRAGCAREGILSVKSEPKTLELPRGEMKPIEEDTIYYPKALKIGCGKLKVMIGYSPSAKSIQDIYVIRSGQGGCEKNIQAVAIYMSAMLRLGGNLFMMERSIEGISGCPSFALAKGRGEELTKGNTCPLAILYLLKEFEKEMGLNDYEKAQERKAKREKQEIEREKGYTDMNKVKCPECGEELEISGGCYSCRSCGYSKCE